MQTQSTLFQTGTPHLSFKFTYQGELYKPAHDFLKTVNVTALYFILTVGENGTHLVGCMGLRKHPTNKSGKPAPRPGPPPEEVGWNRPAPRPERRYLRPPPLVPKSFQFCWTLTRNTAKKLLKTHLLICELFQFKSIISSVGHANCTCNHQSDCTTQSIYVNNFKCCSLAGEFIFDFLQVNNTTRRLRSLFLIWSYSKLQSFQTLMSPAMFCGGLTAGATQKSDMFCLLL